MSRQTVDLASLRRFGFLTLPNYSMIAFSNALEACRMANYVGAQPRYAWRVVTLDGAPAPASNGLTILPTKALSEAGPLDLLFVCGGIDVRHATGPHLREALRRLARRGVALGSLCTGTFALAEAGLLEGYRCAIHWENLAAVREEFSGVTFVDDLFVIDRDRLSCTGGIAPLDMMLALIEAGLGRPLAGKVSDQFIVERGRAAGEQQTSALHTLSGARHAALERAVRIMRENVEAPLGMAAIAARAGVSTRQLERVFKQHLALRPAECYSALRLDRARELLRLSPLSITQVGLACGFGSASHFSTAYRRRFGRSPRAERART